MDQNKLRSLVFEKTGVKVDSDDPIFALVALNETVLAEAVGRHLALMEDASKKLDKQLKQLQKFGVAAAAPAPVAPRAKTVDNWESDDGDASSVPPSTTTATTGAKPPSTIPAAGLAALNGAHWQLGAAAAAIALAAALLVVGAQALFGRSPALSAQQIDKMAHADKLDQAMQKLDPKMREAIALEMKKP